jgi:ubiquinol-cytochrome c reductase cytochrome c subunit
VPIQPEKVRARRNRFGLGVVLLFVLSATVCIPGADAQTQSLNPAGTPSNPSAKPRPLPGATMFAQHCAVCHGRQGEGRSALVSIAGPSLQAEHDLNHVLGAIREGRGVMPGFATTLRAQDIQDVAGYVTRGLATIPLQGGNIGEGGELYRMYCAACHRTAARGGALAFVGVNAPDLMDKSPAVVAGAIRWGPGPMPAFPATVLNDQQLDSIVQYVSYVQHPAKPGGVALNWYGPVAEGVGAWVFVFVLGGFTMWIEKGGKG